MLCYYIVRQRTIGRTGICIHNLFNCLPFILFCNFLAYLLDVICSIIGNRYRYRSHYYKPCCISHPYTHSFIFIVSWWEAHAIYWHSANLRNYFAIYLWLSYVFIWIGDVFVHIVLVCFCYTNTQTSRTFSKNTCVNKKYCIIAWRLVRWDI